MALSNNRKKQRGNGTNLEDLPLEILVKLACCVGHEDLRQLISVSRTIKEAAMIAKEIHFDQTPPLETRVLVTDKTREPMQLRKTRPQFRKNFPQVAFFLDDEEEQ